MTPKKLSILMLCHHRRHKAAGRSHPMAKNMVLRGHKVTLIVISEHSRFSVKETQWDGVRIIETPDLLWGRLRSGWDIWDLINRMVVVSQEKEPYDLVHCFETRPVTIYPGLYYKGRHNIPLITDWNDWFGRGGIISILRPKWYQYLFGGMETYYEEAYRMRGDGLTVISKALVQRAVKLGISEDNICYIPGGTSPDSIPARSIAECRQRFGYSLSAPMLGFASADSFLDLEIALKSLAILSKKYPDIKMIVTGKAGKSVIDSVRSFGVENQILLTGFVPSEDLPWYLGCANLFLLPFPDTVYNIGRWPNKIGIYMSVGRPTVSNPFGDIKPLFEQNPIGLLAEYEVADFSQKIIDLIENPPLAYQLGENARKIAITQYDWNKLICRLEDFYYQVLDSKAGKTMANGPEKTWRN
jgi:glycosyltransferase involved in cell wall biosynthesis